MISETLVKRKEWTTGNELVIWQCKINLPVKLPCCMYESLSYIFTSKIRLTYSLLLELRSCTALCIWIKINNFNPFQMHSINRTGYNSLPHFHGKDAIYISAGVCVCHDTALAQDPSSTAAKSTRTFLYLFRVPSIQSKCWNCSVTRCNTPMHISFDPKPGTKSSFNKM